jgi:hypothetical protein
MSSLARLDRIKGSLLGGAVGDALGAGIEFLSLRLTAVEHMGKGGGPIEYSDVRDRLAHLVDREAAAGEPAEDNITTH